MQFFSILFSKIIIKKPVLTNYINFYNYIYSCFMWILANDGNFVHFRYINKIQANTIFDIYLDLNFILNIAIYLLPVF